MSFQNSGRPTLLGKPSGTTLGQHPNDDRYNMSNKNRGIALVFNHQYFDNSIYYKERKGTEHDRNAMAKVLKQLGFHVEIYDDYDKSQILDALTVVSKMDHSENDCLVVAVMTHGGTSGRLYAKDRPYNTNDIIAPFTGDLCPSLAGKPKLFFFQACRGDQTDSGVQVQTDSAQPNRITYTIPTMADILVMYATVEGYYAWRDTLKGGCFIQSLARKLEAHYKTLDLLSILTLVNREVAIGFQSKSINKEFDKKKEMSSIVSMLTRTLYFDEK